MQVLVLGNVAVDDAVRVEDWPQPGHSVLAAGLRRDLGGKGANQAVLLARAGAAVRFIAAVGDDAESAWLASVLAGEGLAPDALIRRRGPSDRSIVLVGRGGDNAIVTTADCARALDAATATRAVSDMAALDVLVMQGNLTVEATRAALAAARARGAATVLNPSPVQAGWTTLWSLVTLAVLNEAEAAGLAGAADPAGAAQALHAAGAERVVITLGGRGALSLGPGGMASVPAAPAVARDTTGAGDTFAAVLAAALFHRGLAIEPALRAAAAAAAITVSRPGTWSALPTRSELAAILASSPS